jgi:phosphate transport system substrate-binding protein
VSGPDDNRKGDIDMRHTSTATRGAIVLGLGLTLAAAAAGTAARAEDVKKLTGAGSSAIYPVLSKWADTYRTKAGVEVNYQSIGSGGGIAQIKAKTVDFAATDKPLTSEDLARSGLVQFPGIVIGISPVVNIPGIGTGKLTLDPKTLAGIFLGRIARWDDPALKALNKDVPLPDLAIAVVHRSDGSGTTFTFTDYLCKVSPDWKEKVGSDTAVKWPTGLGGKGNPGVAAYVQQISGSIGYVEYAYAVQNKLACTRMVNAEGKTVSPSIESFSAAAAGADFGSVKDFYLILTNQPGAASWPITGATWILMRKDSPAETNRAVLRFMEWFLKDGQEQARALDYVPLPAVTVDQIKAYWSKELDG